MILNNSENGLMEGSGLGGGHFECSILRHCRIMQDDVAAKLEAAPGDMPLN